MAASLAETEVGPTAKTGVIAASIDARYRDVMHLSGLVLYLSNAASPDARSHAQSLQRSGQRSGVEIKVTSISPNELVALRTQSAPIQRENSEAIDTAKRILGEASRLGVSDIHFASAEHELRVEYRLDGDIRRTKHVFDRQQGERLLSALYQSMSGVADSLFKPKESQDANIDQRYLPPELHSARIATSPLPAGPLMVIRLQYRPSDKPASLDDLDIEPIQRKVLDELLRLPAGLIVMVGITGSGKTTTLANLLSALYVMSEGKVRIITVEDPVERPIPGAMQIAVTNAGTDAERAAAFANAVRRAMRLDPDVLMVGEMRDEATAQSTMRAALTGHLAFSTLHAMSPHLTLARLKDLGVSELDLTDPNMVCGVLYQALLPRLCRKCKVPLETAEWPGKDDWLSSMSAHVAGHKIYCRNPSGCEECDGTGYKSRLPVFEVIRTDERYLSLAFSRKPEAAVAHIRSRGMITVHEHALLRILRGEIDPRDADKALKPLAARLPCTEHRVDAVSTHELRSVPLGPQAEASVR